MAEIQSAHPKAVGKSDPTTMHVHHEVMFLKPVMANVLTFNRNGFKFR